MLQLPTWCLKIQNWPGVCVFKNFCIQVSFRVHESRLKLKNDGDISFLEKKLYANFKAREPCQIKTNETWINQPTSVEIIRLEQFHVKLEVDRKLQKSFQHLNVASKFLLLLHSWHTFFLIIHSNKSTSASYFNTVFLFNFTICTGWYTYKWSSSRRWSRVQMPST